MVRQTSPLQIAVTCLLTDVMYNSLLKDLGALIQKIDEEDRLLQFDTTRPESMEGKLTDLTITLSYSTPTEMSSNQHGDLARFITAQSPEQASATL